MSEKPPLGIMPKIIWEEQRAAELVCAIKRHVEHFTFRAEAKRLNDWVEELAGFTERFAAREDLANARSD